MLLRAVECDLFDEVCPYSGLDKVAVKVISKGHLDTSAMELITNEATLLNECIHPRVIRLFQEIDTLHDKFLILEYAGGGTLQQLIEREGTMLLVKPWTSIG